MTSTPRTARRAAADLTVSRAQRYAAYPTPEQAAILRRWGSAANWLYNQANRSQLNRWAAHAGIETSYDLGNAVRDARDADAGWTYLHDGQRYPLSEVP